MIDFKEILDGENWELFCRDFLEEIGYRIESPPDRGADGKKDLIVSEYMKGNFFEDKIKILVSCKHYAHRKKSNSVSERDEPDLFGRIRRFGCDSFIGFYSTITTTGLNSGLYQLKEKNEIKDYMIFDHKKIEKYLDEHLSTKEYHDLIKRYFPESYKKIYAIFPVIGDYVPLKCSSCDRDILKNINDPNYSANLLEVIIEDSISKEKIFKRLYTVCSKDCQTKISKKLNKIEKISLRITNIEELIVPGEYLKMIHDSMDKNNHLIYLNNTFEDKKQLITALAQRVFRIVNPENRKIIDNSIKTL